MQKTAVATEPDKRRVNAKKMRLSTGTSIVVTSIDVPSGRPAWSRAFSEDEARQTRDVLDRLLKAAQ